MLINGDGETLLRFVLTDNVLIKKSFDFARLGKRWSRGYGFCLLVVGDDLVADVDALITDVHSRTGNEFLHFVLRLAAEGAAQSVIGSSYHSGGKTP
jgi:hypothetical protein